MTSNEELASLTAEHLVGNGDPARAGIIYALLAIADAIEATTPPAPEPEPVGTGEGWTWP